MNLQRWTLLVTTSLLATMVYAVQSNAFPKWTILLGLAVFFLTQLVQALTNAVQIPPADPASKVATPRRPPPLPILLAIALIGCSASQKQAEIQSGPDCLKCAIELVPVFAVKAPHDAGADR